MKDEDDGGWMADRERASAPKVDSIRVLRLVEYVYQDAAVAADDMGRWTHELKTPKMQMRSAALPFEVVPWPATDAATEAATEVELCARSHFKGVTCEDANCTWNV